MTQLLSLAFGNISPLGLSGGATPSNTPGLGTPGSGFADLLAAPSMKGAAGPFAPATPGESAGAVLAYETPPGLGKSLSLPSALLGEFAGSAKPLSGPDVPTLPQPGAAKPTPGAQIAPDPTALPDMLATPLDGSEPPVAEGAQLPRSTAPSDSDDAQPMTAPTTQDGAPVPEVAPPALSVAAQPTPTPAQVEQAAIQLPSPADPASPDADDGVDAFATDQRDETLPESGINIPGAAPQPGPAQTANDAAHDGTPAEDAPRDAGSKDSTPVRDSFPARSASESASASASTTDFGKLVERAPTENAAPMPDDGGAIGEMLPQSRTDPLRSPAGTSATAPSAPATVSARPGEIGHQLGVEIVRHGLDGRDRMTIRLDPVEMGEIEIRLQFDDRGTMRAHVSAESSAALDMLRRDSGDLVRALADAGVRTDAQSFQFESRGHGRGDQHGQQPRPDPSARPDTALADAESDDQPRPQHKLRTSGSLDFFA